jgi:hypothetical protein
VGALIRVRRGAVFSPAEELLKTDAVMMKYMQAMQGG